MTCEDQLKDIDFLGGTFVEYKDGYGTQIEFGRGVIAQLKCNGDALSIDTEKSLTVCEGVLKLGIPHLHSSGCSVTKHPAGYWLIETGPFLGWVCAIAPKGVEIPKPVSR